MQTFPMNHVDANGYRFAAYIISSSMEELWRNLERRKLGVGESQMLSGTELIHADDHLAQTSDVAPTIHPSTTHNYPRDIERLKPARELANSKLGGHLDEFVNGEVEPEAFVYSRLHSPTVSRAEAVLSKVLGGYAMAFSSGLAAIHALFVHLNPKRVAIGDAYHGTHGILDILKRNYGTQVVGFNEVDKLEKGDVYWLESPVNPYGNSLDIAQCAKDAHDRGAWMCIDSTFAPPPLANPLNFGADFAVHSATKFLGGHSDLLSGIIVGRSKEAWDALFMDRLLLGTILPTLESFLLLRSLRTLHLRVPVQSRNATEIVTWLVSLQQGKISGCSSSLVKKIWHNSLQSEKWVAEQNPGGFSPVFSFTTQSEMAAKQFCTSVRLFHHATSLGGVESLVEWRAMSDEHVDPTLIRVSVGVENVNDLIDDMKKGFAAMK